MDSRKITDRERSEKMITTVPTYPVQFGVDYPDRELAGEPADLRCRHRAMTHRALYPRTAGRPVAATSGCGRRLADGRGMPVHTPGPGTVRGGKGR